MCNEKISCHLDFHFSR